MVVILWMDRKLLTNLYLANSEYNHWLPLSSEIFNFIHNSFIDPNFSSTFSMDSKPRYSINSVNSLLVTSNFFAVVVAVVVETVFNDDFNESRTRQVDWKIVLKQSANIFFTEFSGNVNFYQVNMKQKKQNKHREQKED